MRGSFVIFEAMMIASLVQWHREQLTRGRGRPLAFSRDRRRCRRITLLPLPRRRGGGALERGAVSRPVQNLGERASPQCPRRVRDSLVPWDLRRDQGGQKG